MSASESTAKRELVLDSGIEFVRTLMERLCLQEENGMDQSEATKAFA